jgi:hypothetical protein
VNHRFPQAAKQVPAFYGTNSFIFFTTFLLWSLIRARLIQFTIWCFFLMPLLIICRFCGVPPLPGYRPATSWVHYTTSCNTQYSAPEDGQNNCPKHVELSGIINKPLLLHLVGCLYYLYQWCMVKQRVFLFLSDFPTKFHIRIFLSTIRTPRPSYKLLIHFITRMTFGDERKS